MISLGKVGAYITKGVSISLVSKKIMEFLHVVYIEPHDGGKINIIGVFDTLEQANDVAHDAKQFMVNELDVGDSEESYSNSVSDRAINNSSFAPLSGDVVILKIVQNATMKAHEDHVFTVLT